MRLAEDIAIVGIGQSDYGRRVDRPIQSLIFDAITAAISDAGLEPCDIDGIVTENEFVTSFVGAHDVIATLGLRDDTFTAASGYAGSGIVAAPAVAAMALRHGLATAVVSYFGVNWGSTNGAAYAAHAESPAKVALEMPFGFFGQPVYFAAVANRYRHEYGLTQEQLGAVAVSARTWAALNPAAQEQAPLDLQTYLRSPVISDPLRRLDCCLLSDGAAAFIMTTPERARDLKHAPVTVAASSTSFADKPVHAYFTQSADLLATQAGVTGPRAMAAAHVAPSDIDFVNLYDCFTITGLMQFEDLGFVPKGEAGAFFEEGHTLPGGSLPVNPHGGLLSDAYLVGVTNVTEAVRQIRGEAGVRQIPGAEVGVISGYGPEQTTIVVTADR